VAIEETVMAGHPDLDGLFMAWTDWQMELRLIEEEIGIRRRQ
jgi:hypothetical protein